jgi:O-Antigen ligase
MELFRSHSWVADVGPSGTTRALAWLLGLLSLLALTVLLPLSPTPVGIAILGGWIVLIWVAISFIRGKFDYVVLVWVAVFPFCYYLFSYPAERAIFTVDRAFIALLAIELFCMSRRIGATPLTRDLRISACFWGLFLLVCFGSLAGHHVFDVLGSYRLLLDGMLMPALLGLYAVRLFPITHNLSKLHGCVCVLMLGIAVVCGSELVTGKNLLPWPGAIETWVYNYDVRIPRVDGPFEQPGVLSVVAILAFFLIIYLWRLMPRGISRWQQLLHKGGALASFTMALIPLNRGLVFALVPIALIDTCSRNRLLSRRIWAAIFGTILVFALAAKLLYPRIYDDRVASPDNVYQRLAQDRETLRVVRDHPFFGVGFNLYHDVASREPRYLAQWKGIESMNLPHNVLMTVLSEEGIVGLLFYVLAQFFFVRAIWRIRENYPAGWLAFLYCLLVYVVIGLDDAIVYFSDINLFYIFILGTLYQLQARIVREQDFVVLTSQNPSLQVF